METNEASSTLGIVEIDLPQDLLLGPRPYAIYTNDLPNAMVIRYIHMFAEDTTIYHIRMEIEDSRHAKYRIKGFLTVQMGKTEAMLISARLFTGPMRPIRFICVFINFTTKSTCLGIVSEG